MPLFASPPRTSRQNKAEAFQLEFTMDELAGFYEQLEVGQQQFDELG